MNEAVIVSAVRTPLGNFTGSLAGIGATRLGALVIAEAVRRAGIDKESIDEVIMGQVLPCGYGQNPGQAGRRAGRTALAGRMPDDQQGLRLGTQIGDARRPGDPDRGCRESWWPAAWKP